MAAARKRGAIMATLTNYGWYLGNLSNIEVDPGSILGTYGTPSDPMYLKATSLTASLPGPQTLLLENTSNHTFTYDVGGGAVTQQLEQMNHYAVSYLLNDGTTGTADMWVVQAPNGDTFLLTDEGADNDPLETHGLDAVTLVSVIATDFDWQTTYHTTAVPLCFREGTRIRTPSGERAIERLAAGDAICTLDHGPQSLRWAGRTASAPPDAYCRFGRNLLGNVRPLVLTAAHRVLVRHPLAELWHGSTEVLVPACAFLRRPGAARPGPNGRGPLYHLLFDRHEIVFAEGAAVESLFLGDGCAAPFGRGVPRLFRREARRAGAAMTAARPFLTRVEAERLLVAAARSRSGGLSPFARAPRAAPRGPGVVPA